MKPTIFFAESTHQLETRLHEVFSGKGSPNLAIVFCSVIHDMNSVRRVFNSFGIAVFGASTSGEIVNTEVHEETMLWWAAG